MAESAEIDPLQEIMDEYWKNKEGKLPTEGDLEMCAKIQDIVEKKIFTSKQFRRARKQLKKAPPDSEAAKKATTELNKAIHGMACLDRVRNAYGRCPVWNCDKHPATDGNFQNEMYISSSTETAPEIDEEGKIAPWKEKGINHGVFQTVSPHKVARPTTMEVDPTPVEMTNKFSQLAEGNAPITSPRRIPEINLKVAPNVNQTLKEICQQFPLTENRLQKDFIRIRADSEDSREKNHKIPQREKLGMRFK
ncbi:hypothetical protein AVEN_172100-1 [Araneus ventricosus]|uniref:Uncharacterized protein n=1 Tax=Araneus ventricosus TaxID=182803 RepID=A0A4Y2EBV8_ARAVE|nr:hypothetical protein AVEN_137196-1 [Araneus ventricosus]GBM25315.1 hypothetical protein AVEN_172100-1 [Araneus ventricosus]